MRWSFAFGESNSGLIPKSFGKADEAEVVFEGSLGAVNLATEGGA